RSACLPSSHLLVGVERRASRQPVRFRSSLHTPLRIGLTGPRPRLCKDRPHQVALGTCADTLPKERRSNPDGSPGQTRRHHAIPQDGFLSSSAMWHRHGTDTRYTPTFLAPCSRAAPTITGSPSESCAVR